MPRTKKAAEVAEEKTEKIDEAVASGETKTPPRRKTGAAQNAAPKAQTANAVAPMVYVQYGEFESDVSALVEAAKADFEQNNAGAIAELKLYIKPEDGMAYYVINGVEGKIAL